MDPSFWTELELPQSDLDLNLTAAYDLLDRCPLLRHLKIRRRNDSDLIAFFAVEYCPKVINN